MVEASATFYIINSNVLESIILWCSENDESFGTDIKINKVPRLVSYINTKAIAHKNMPVCVLKDLIQLIPDKLHYLLVSVVGVNCLLRYLLYSFLKI